MAASIEFVRIAGYPVKVTSLARDDTSGSITLVVITRGSADRNHLDDLLAQAPVTLELPDEPSIAMSVEGVDARVVGEGEQAITRFSIRFVPVDVEREVQVDEPDRHFLEDRLAIIEQKLDLVLEALTLIESQRRVERA